MMDPINLRRHNGIRIVVEASQLVNTPSVQLKAIAFTEEEALDLLAFLRKYEQEED